MSSGGNAATKRHEHAEIASQTREAGRDARAGGLVPVRGMPAVDPPRHGRESASILDAAFIAL
jgi:hypothetical protein